MKAHADLKSRRGFARCHFFTHLLFAFVFSLGSAFSMAGGQTEWLLVVDTSYSMRKKHDNSIKIVRELFSDSFNQLIREGEQIRFWTFREALLTNQFTPLAWEGTNKAVLTEKAVQILQLQKYSRQTRLAPVLNSLQAEAYQHSTLVAFLLTDGDDEVKGTPFDGALNGDFLLYRRNLKRANQPFLTMLVYQRGFCVAARVHPGIGRITIPLDRPPLAEISSLADQTDSSPPKVEDIISDPLPEQIPFSAPELFPEAESADNRIETYASGASLPVKSGVAQIKNEGDQHAQGTMLHNAPKPLEQRPMSGAEPSGKEGEPNDPDLVAVAPEKIDPVAKSSSLTFSTTAESAPAMVSLPSDGEARSRRNRLSLILLFCGVVVAGGVWWRLGQGKPRASLISESFIKK